MDNVYDLVNNLKKLALGANQAEEPMSVDFAEVVTVNPLKLNFGAFKVAEKDDLLVLTSRITGLRDDDKLKKGNAVVCLQEPGGEGWVVLDKVEV